MSSPQAPLVPAPDWDNLPVSQRLLLLVLWFIEGLGLASLITFFGDSSWLVRAGLFAGCMLPQFALYWLKPALRGYLPGLLVAMLGLLLGMVPGVIAEQVAEAAGAVPAVSKGLFVVLTGVGMAGVVSLAYRRRTAADGRAEVSRVEPGPAAARPRG